MICSRETSYRAPAFIAPRPCYLSSLTKEGEVRAWRCPLEFCVGRIRNALVEQFNHSQVIEELFAFFFCLSRSKCGRYSLLRVTPIVIIIGSPSRGTYPLY